MFWNGPVGVFEFPAFSGRHQGRGRGDRRLPGLTVVGGGDSAAAVRRLGLPEDGFSHISTGGGASLEYLEGTTLPGLAALEERWTVSDYRAARKPLIVGNWKMHNNHFEAIALTQKLAFALTRQGLRRPPTSRSCRRSPRCAASRP